MKELEKTFTKGDKIYHQVSMSSRAYIYKVSDSTNDAVYFEVFKRIETTAKYFKGKHYPAGVKYPSNTDFGYSAFCISYGVFGEERALKKATEKFNDLNKQKDEAHI